MRFRIDIGHNQNMIIDLITKIMYLRYYSRTLHHLPVVTYEQMSTYTYEYLREMGLEPDWYQTSYENSHFCIHSVITEMVQSAPSQRTMSGRGVGVPWRIRRNHAEEERTLAHNPNSPNRPDKCHNLVHQGSLDRCRDLVHQGRPDRCADLVHQGQIHHHRKTLDRHLEETVPRFYQKLALGKSQQ